MKTIRTFVAVPLEDDVRRSAVRLIEDLRRPGDGIRWVPTDNLHLTLKFLGEVDNVEVPGVCDVVRDAVENVDPFELHFGGVGGLPDLDRARVLTVEIEDPSHQLTELVMRLEEQYAARGFKREPRDYVPHLTLGRAKSRSRRADRDVIDRMHQLHDESLGAMVVTRIHVFASFMDKAGPTYQVMDTVEL